MIHKRSHSVRLIKIPLKLIYAAKIILESIIPRYKLDR